MTGPARARRTAAAEGLAVAAVTALLQLPIFDRAMFLMDEGHILMFADILTDGGELYRDATLLPLPGAFYLLAGAFELFGPSIRVARGIALAEFAVLCGLAFVVLRQLAPRGFAYAGVLALWIYRIWAYPHWHMYSYSTLSMTLLAGALVAMMGFVARGGLARVSVAGLLVGLAVACKQDYGAAGLVAMSATLWVRHASAGPRSPERGPRAWLAFIAPAVGVGAVVAVHYLRRGLFGELIQQTLLNHLFGIATFEYTSLPPLLPLFGQTPVLRDPSANTAYLPSLLVQLEWPRVQASALYTGTILWDLALKLFFYAPYAFAAAAVWRLWRRRTAAREPERRSAYLGELALASLAIALLLALNKPVDYVHVVVLYWPWLLLGCAVAGGALRDRPRALRVCALAGALPALAVAVFTVWLAWRLVETHDTPLAGERAGVRVVADDARVVGEMVAYAADHSAPGEVFPVLPYFPLISFLADRDAPHRAMYTFWPVAYIPDREEQIIEAIDRAPTDRLLYHFTQFVVFPRMPEYAPKLFAHLVDRYEIERVFTSRYWSYMAAGARRAPPPPGVPLIDRTAPRVALRVEHDDGRPDQVVGPARAAELFTTALWPLRPVFELRPLSGARRSVASLPVDVPLGARLQTAVSVHPTLWFHHPPSWVRFAVRARVGDRVDVLFERTLRPHTDPADRRWFDVDVDLSRYANARIALEFTAECELPFAERHAMGGWEIPRLVRADARSVTP